MEHEDEFEYHITFPSGDSSKFLENQSEKEPVVVLLGWAGCIDKHLAKYSAIYDKHGCTTLRYIAPFERLLSVDQRGQLRPHAAKLIELLEDMTFLDHAIFFHAFSNGGALMYDLVQELLDQRPQVNLKVSGCIFDSTPAQVNLFQFLKAVHVAAKGDAWWKLLVVFLAFIKVVGVRLMMLISHFLFLPWRAHYRTIDLWHNLAVEPPRCPQLFLYSAYDDICSSTSIEKFIALRKKKGVMVSTVKWDDSPHVQHYLYHPEEYAHTVLDFVYKHASIEMIHQNSKEKNSI